MHFHGAGLVCRGSLWALLLLAAWVERSSAWQEAGQVLPAGAERAGSGSAQAGDGRALPPEAPRELAPPTARRVPTPAAEDRSGTAFVDDAPSDDAPIGRQSGSGQNSGPRSIAAPAARKTPIIEAAKLGGIQPGVSKLRDLQQAWGEPKGVQRFTGYVEHTYHQEPFQKVTVTLVKETVTSMVLYLPEKYPVDAVTRQLELDELEPVLVTNEQGEVLGQAFPERGVLFSFDPGQTEYLVSQILLRAIEFQPFALRAEAHLQSNYELAMSDLSHALQLNPRYARGHSMRAQLHAAMGRLDPAAVSIEEALRLEPANGEYRLMRAYLLEQQGQHARAVSETRNVLNQSGLIPLVRSRALTQLAGLLASGPERNFHAAVEHRQEAIKILEPLADDRHPAVRRTAKELLVSAYLGNAHDIAWGAWNRKGQVVPKWLHEADNVAQEAIAAGDGDLTLGFRVGQQALSALAGMKGELDPTAWVEVAQQAGKSLIDDAGDPLTRRQREWTLALAMYDAVQTYHSRGQAEEALACGRQGAELMERATQGQPRSTLQTYLMGRMYFRLGAAFAVLAGEHTEAIAWYEKAQPLLAGSVASQPRESGKHGEALISMAVSYWDAGEHKKAVQLTNAGLDLMQRAVRDGLMSEAALAVAYGNMATMHRHLGDEQSAQRFAQMASRSQTSRQ